MFDPQTFAATLRSARKRAKLSQKELAARLYLSTQAVSKWERGEALPGLSHVYQLSQLLQVSADELLGTAPTGETALIAVDGGGSKTEFVLISLEGRLLKRLILPGSNPNTCTVEGACDILRRGIDTLLQEGCRVLAVYIGGAGMASAGNGSAAEAILRKAYPHLPLRCESDILNVLACADDPQNAIAAICGTGSVVYTTCQGKLLRCGGAGWKLETLGSGYDMGRSAILAALEHRDGTGPVTALTAAVEQKLGGRVWEQIGRIYGEPPAFFAAFAPLVVQAWQAGDRVATGIIEENCARIAQLIHTAAKKSPDARQVLLGGSLLLKNEPFRRLLTGMLSPSLKISPLPCPPVWGACLRCAQLAKVAAPNIRSFMEHYAQEE